MSKEDFSVVALSPKFEKNSFDVPLKLENEAKRIKVAQACEGCQLNTGFSFFAFDITAKCTQFAPLERNNAKITVTSTIPVEAAKGLIADGLDIQLAGHLIQGVAACGVDIAKKGK